MQLLKWKSIEQPGNNGRSLDSHVSGMSVFVCLQWCLCSGIIKGKFCQIEISARTEKVINILLSSPSCAIKVESIPLQIKMHK